MKNSKPIFTVLAIDGGGVRGVIPARILQEIEQRTGKPIAELFDMVGGTSTGAIIGGCLVAPDPKNPARPRFSAKDVLGFYHRLAGRIFPEIRFKALRKLSGGALYDPRPLEDALKESFGDMAVADALTSFSVPVTDIENFRPVWIDHIKGVPDASPERWSSMRLRDVARAATSMPTLFPAAYYEIASDPASSPATRARHALIDGGFFGGNMMRHLLARARQIAPKDAEIVIVHVGTGSTDNRLTPDEFNSLTPLGLLSKANGSILLSWVTKMALFDTQNDIRNEIGDNLFIFDTKLGSKDAHDLALVSADDARKENLKRLEDIAEGILQDHGAEIDRLCGLLQARQGLAGPAPAAQTTRGLWESLREKRKQFERKVRHLFNPHAADDRSGKNGTPPPGPDSPPPQPDDSYQRPKV